MREATRRRLDRALRRQRLTWLGYALAGTAALAGLFLLTNLDATVEDHRVQGRVERVSIPNLKTAVRTVAVLLDDGRHVQVIALKVQEPHVGDRVAVTEHRHGTGRVTFTWR
jgi:hypothetical protein